MGSTLIDLTGKTIHGVEVLRRSDQNTRWGKPRWVCRCQCGKEFEVAGLQLRRPRGHTKSCGCQKPRGARHAAWRGVGEISATWWHRRILYSTSPKKKTNRRKDIAVKLTMAQAWQLFLEQDRKCALTGLPLTISEISQNNTASLDRIDSRGDYELENVQWVHRDINYMKQAYSQEYFIEMCKRVAAHAA